MVDARAFFLFTITPSSQAHQQVLSYVATLLLLDFLLISYRSACHFDIDVVMIDYQCCLQRVR